MNNEPRTAQDVEDEELKLLEERLKGDSYVQKLIDSTKDQLDEINSKKKSNRSFNYAAFNEAGTCGYAADSYKLLVTMICDDGDSVADYTFYEMGTQVTPVFVKAKEQAE